MIAKIIQKIMNELNYSVSDLSLLTNLTQRTIRNTLSGQEVSLDTLQKLEQAFQLDFGELMFYKNKEDLKKIKMTETYQFLWSFRRSTDLSKEIVRLFRGPRIENYKLFLEKKSINYYKFKNKELAYFWVALMENVTQNIHAIDFLDRTREAYIINTYLNLMFGPGKLNYRIGLFSNFLLKMGIVLENGPFIPGSSIKGVSLKKNKTWYIFLNDNSKREYSYIFTLGTQLLSIFKPKEDVKSLIRKKIERYLGQNNIKHEILNAFKIFDMNIRYTEKLDLLHEQMVLRNEFEDYKIFITNQLNNPKKIWRDYE